MSAALAGAMLAIVMQDQAPLRAAAGDSAPREAMLMAGQILELRGARGDYVRVYDLTHEREGYVRAAQVEPTALTPEGAPNLLAVMRFLRGQPGSEALGISIAAAYLKSVPAKALNAEPFDAVGLMAERLARRASSRQTKAGEAATMAQLDVVAGLGVHMNSFEQNGAVQMCYDGEMFRQALIMASATPSQQADAALGLTRHECIDPELGPTDRYQYDLWREVILSHIAMDSLDAPLTARLLMRRAGVRSELAYWQSRRGLNSQLAAQRSIEDLANVNKTALDAEALNDYAEASVRVGASRLAAQTSTERTGNLIVRTAAGRPGETCVALYDVRKPGDAPLVSRCTFSIVWPSSATASADGSALALAVQPLPTWRELWVFRRTDSGWTISMLPPDNDGPGKGYIEAAGWAPNSKRMLVVRESHLNGHLRRHFEVVRLDTLASVAQAAELELLGGVERWEDPIWRGNTVALR